MGAFAPRRPGAGAGRCVRGDRCRSPQLGRRQPPRVDCRHRERHRRDRHLRTDRRPALSPRPVCESLGRAAHGVPARGTGVGDPHGSAERSRFDRGYHRGRAARRDDSQPAATLPQRRFGLLGRIKRAAAARFRAGTLALDHGRARHHRSGRARGRAGGRARGLLDAGHGGRGLSRFARAGRPRRSVRNGAAPSHGFGASGRGRDSPVDVRIGFAALGALRGEHRAAQRDRRGTGGTSGRDGDARTRYPRSAQHRHRLRRIDSRSGRSGDRIP